MSASDGPRPSGDESPPPVDVGHPRGTLAIVLILAGLFAAAWWAAYLLFLSRGTPHH